jgi:hypothetical protein
VIASPFWRLAVKRPLGAAFAAALLALVSPSSVKAFGENDSMPLTQVVEALKSEIAIARLAQRPDDARFRIEAVDIELTAIAKQEGQGGISLEIPIVQEVVGGLEIGEKTQLSSTQKISLKLRPRDGFEDVSGAGSLGLAPAIQSVRSVLREAMRPPAPFAVDGFVFEAEFVVARSLEGTVKFVFLEAGANAAGIAKQRVAVHMVLAD